MALPLYRCHHFDGVGNVAYPKRSSHDRHDRRLRCCECRVVSAFVVMGFLLLFFLTSSPPASSVVQCLESQSMAKTVVILLLAFALAGCTQVVTDVTTVSDPGRYEVSLPGSGVTRRDPIPPCQHIETSASDHRVTRLGPTGRVRRSASRRHGTTAFGTRIRSASALHARMAALQRMGRLRNAATRRCRKSRGLAGNAPGR